LRIQIDGVLFPGKGKLRVEPLKLSIVQLGMQRDVFTGAFRNMHAEMHGICCARRDQMHVNDRTAGPSISFVDGIAVRIDLQGLVEMRTRFNRALAVVGRFAAPEDGLPSVVGGLQFQPHVEGVDGSAREEMTDFARSHDNIDQHFVAATHGCIHASQGSGDWASLARRATRQGSICFLADGKCGGELLFRQLVGIYLPFVLAGRRDCENVDTELLVLQEFLACQQLRRVFICRGHRRVCAREAVGVDIAIDVAFVLRSH
jgi:hypothetical protein